MKVPPGRAMRKKAGKGRGHPVGFELGADATAYFSSKVRIVTSHELVRLSIYTCIGFVGVEATMFFMYVISVIKPDILLLNVLNTSE